MPMNPNFLCCIGAELKNSTQQTTRMSQVYFYRAFEEETVADMLQPGFFDAAMGIVRKDDLLLLYDPKNESARWTYCRVSNVDRSGVEISLMGINAKDVLVEILGEDPITLQSLIDNTIMPAIENIGDMDLPVITEGGTAPTNLSEAIRQIVTQDLTLSEDSVEPQSGQFSLWGAIKKALGNAKNFFSSISDLDTRLNALEGQGGPVGSYDFGKSFPNILDATDTQLVAGVMVDNIWAGHTPIVWTTPIANSTFTDGDGVDRTVGEIFNGTWIINSYDGTRIVLTNTPNTTPPIFSYQNVGVYSVGFANATTAGVVRVGTGSDMTVDQATGDISIDNTKGYSIFHRLISLFTGTQKTQILEDLNAASRDMDNLTSTGKANVSKQGTYDSGETYSAGTIGAAIAGKADSATTLAGYNIADGANTNLSNLTTTGKVTSAHLAMPSNIYVDLTLPASGGNITAPADGYIHFAKNSTAANQRIKLYSSITQMAVASWSTGAGAYNIEVLLPVSKGEVVNVLYTAGGPTNFFRFIYANGAQ